jgi:hypothetical protein
MNQIADTQLLDGYCAIWRGDPLARRAKLGNALVTANVSRLEMLRPPLESRGGSEQSATAAIEGKVPVSSS